MKDLVVKAPAKINLSLEILQKRADGFHELVTLMVPLKELYDELVFRPASEFSFSCDMDGVPTDERNLVVRAVKLFEREAQLSVAYHIHLQKAVPHGAGLGGGSSDAAFTLLTLNSLHDEPLSFECLHQLAAELGSDVPFFLYQSACICRGRGELIEPVTGPDFTVCLIKPQFAVPTPDAFTRWQSASEVKGFKYASQQGSFGEMKNDLDRPVFEKFLFLGDLKNWLLDQPEVSVAQMSGSGSTMIAIVADKQSGDALIRRALEQIDDELFTHCGRC